MAIHLEKTYIITKKSIWIKDLNVKYTTIEIPEDNMGKYFYKCIMGKDSLKKKKKRVAGKAKRRIKGKPCGKV